MAERPEDSDSSEHRASPLDPAKQLQASLTNAGPVAGAGYTLIGAILLLGGAGYAGDRWFGTEPWLLLVGLFLGLAVGFYELARIVWR